MDKARVSGKFDRIALSLSGGGVRAAGFHLGSMSMLQQLGLMEKVRIISSVSGGSMPGIGYSLSQRLGRSFQDFFDDFYECWPEMNLFEELLSRLTGREPPCPSGRRDLITAMANVYNDIYFSRYFGSYTEGNLTLDILMKTPHKGHVEEMIFNATEFKTGTAFRFQVSDYRCLIGNESIALCHKHSAKIRIADVMAASSCIPAGMEPMIFPQDFHWPDDGEPDGSGTTPDRPTCEEISDALVRNTDTYQNSFPLMDGGIYDNQGITSTLLAINRQKTKIKKSDPHECGYSLHGLSDPSLPQDWANWMMGHVPDASGAGHEPVSSDDLDLLIISDTPVRRASFYPRVNLSINGMPMIPLQKPAKRRNAWFGKFTLGQVSYVVWFVLLLLAVSAGMETMDLLVAVQTGALRENPLGVGAYITLQLIIPLILILLAGFVLAAIKINKNRAIHKLEALVPRWKENPATYINKLRLSDLVQMVVLRVSSVTALTSAIFANRIRGLAYATAFSRGDLKGHVLNNEIFTLQRAGDNVGDFQDFLGRKAAWPPPPELKRITGKSAMMETRLWIDQEPGDPLNDLDYLVVSGQATICYNLLEYLWQECFSEGAWLTQQSEDLFNHTLDEWKKLLADPVSLLRELKKKVGSPTCMPGQLKTASPI